MVLTEKEKSTIKDLQTQEQECIKKYETYANQACDAELKDLFNQLKENEQQHYNSLQQVLDGQVPSCDCNDDKGRNYSPKGTYNGCGCADQTSKDKDCFLATDSIGTEKMVSGEYNSDVFAFGDSDIRKLLADIQIEEQNHAEMLYKYKQVNGMS
ncbi:spore coat protein [Cellulosilyticum ruminicola]|uniref:spore coat protein n=1 Tax=Cellulosilyticum ruminicola TaxID=425254 RepID=UPI0006CF61E1|nr:ferritin-like domain-containing protein [Cellulosilyticum ruminicola]